MTRPPPMHQPATAAMIGLSVAIPTVGTQRHSSGRSVTSAPAEKARPPTPVRIATRCAPRSVGLANQIVANGTEIEEALALADKIIDLAPLALATIKRFVNDHVLPKG